MARYLLAAEADKIQDLLFRSARLREVVGGSQLLERFCKEVPRHLGLPREDTVVSGGGSFRFLFDSREVAVDFGERLAEVYRLATGGSLTVAPPVEVRDPVGQHFGEASEKAQALLRQAKYRWRGREGRSELLDPPDLWESQEHFPYIAFCSSCGVGLAVDYCSYHSDEPATYRCRSCLNKGGEGRFDEDNEFLTAFYREVIEGADLDDYTWPGRSGKEPLEEVAAFDPRRYVGYLVADGNSMGEVFGRCTSPSQMRFLSSKLEAVIRRALAEPTRLLMQNNPAEDRGNFIPVLPLILGGDDVFVLLPAPWALDFARRFCQAYEAEMEGVLREKGLDRGPRPTVSAAVVIVKSTHPYYRAHEVGENGVKQAKRLAKQIVIETRRAVSTVAFEVVLSGGLDQNRSYSRGVFRPTLQPYLAADGLKEAWGLSVDFLLKARLRLGSAPGKRLAELKRLYDLAGLSASSAAEEMERWQKRLKRLLDRMRKSDSSLADGVQEALESLGDTKYPYWLTVVRPDEEPWKGHGLPDLLAAWDFSLLVDQPRARYEAEVG